MNFKKWVKSMQTAGYNGARKIYISIEGGDKSYPSDFPTALPCLQSTRIMIDFDKGKC